MTTIYKRDSRGTVLESMTIDLDTESVSIEGIQDTKKWTLTTVNESEVSETNYFLGERSTREER